VRILPSLRSRRPSKASERARIERFPGSLEPCVVFGVVSPSSSSSVDAEEPLEPLELEDPVAALDPVDSVASAARRARMAALFKVPRELLARVDPRAPRGKRADRAAADSAGTLGKRASLGRLAARARLAARDRTAGPDLVDDRARGVSAELRVVRERTDLPVVVDVLDCVAPEARLVAQARGDLVGTLVPRPGSSASAASGVTRVVPPSATMRAPR